MLNHVAASTSASPPGTLFTSYYYADGISYTLPYFTPAVSQTFSVNVPSMALPFSFNVSIWQAGMLLNAPHTYLTSGLNSFTFTPGPATSGPVYVDITDATSPAYPIYSYFSGTAQFTIDTITLDSIVLTPMNVVSQIASDDQYHYGFNGQMKVNEWAGVGNHNTALFWEYGTREARRYNLDPRPNPSISNYAAIGNNPIWFSDPLGDTIKVNLFNPLDPLFKMADVVIAEQKKDGVFAVMAHGNSKCIQYYDQNSNDKTITTPREFEAAIEEQSQEFKDAMAEGNIKTIVLYSCNTGSNEYTDLHYGTGKRTAENTIAQQISAANPNVTVIAPDGYVYFAPPDRNGRGKISGVLSDDGKGGFFTIKNGVKLYKKQDSYNPDTKKTSVGPKKKL